MHYLYEAFQVYSNILFWATSPLAWIAYETIEAGRTMGRKLCDYFSE